MEKFCASRKRLRDVRLGARCLTGTACLFALLTTTFVGNAQPVPLKKDNNKAGILSIAYFTESANNSVNSLNSLLRKDSYRNKITTLNNPTNNELGFSLKNEILTALKPLLDKAKKTDHKKFHDVVENLLENPDDHGIGTVKKYLPAVGIFSTILSLVGNLVVSEKKVTKDDLNQFITRIQQYFAQYEKLNAINEQFSEQVHSLLEKIVQSKEDIRDFLVECICTVNRKLTKQALKDISVEALIQQYYDPQKLQDWLDTAKLKTEGYLYPPDAPTTVKLITSNIKKLQKEFESVYSENYTELKELISSLRSTIPNIDQEQLEKTNQEMERLYKDSRQADVINLNLALVDERMHNVCRVINGGR
jgi:hypothetical protein